MGPCKGAPSLRRGGSRRTPEAGPPPPRPPPRATAPRALSRASRCSRVVASASQQPLQAAPQQQAFMGGARLAGSPPAPPSTVAAAAASTPSTAAGALVSASEVARRVLGGRPPRPPSQTQAQQALVEAPARVELGYSDAIESVYELRRDVLLGRGAFGQVRSFCRRAAALLPPRLLRPLCAGGGGCADIRATSARFEPSRRVTNTAPRAQPGYGGAGRRAACAAAGCGA
eukprot:364176-Chlamydomonas_euryale.AAC.3